MYSNIHLSFEVKTRTGVVGRRKVKDLPTHCSLRIFFIRVLNTLNNDSYSLYGYLESSSVSFQCRLIRRHIMNKASSSTKVISLSLIGSFKPLSPPWQTAALPHGAIAYYSLRTMLIWRCYVNLITPCDKFSTAYFRAGCYNRYEG